MKISPRSGFTVIELLIIAAAGALAISIAAVILSSIRFKSDNITALRDSRRLQDLASLRVGLDLYQSQAGGYPDSSLWHAGGEISCGKDEGILRIPYDPLVGNPYTYKGEGDKKASPGCGGNVWSKYAVSFYTEGSTYLGPAGDYCLTSNRGFVVGSCP
ncbi:MAG TPA: hypothetical protein VFX17_00220 [Patescibacteria group bacterium]|nr:hypothetical protein [Patescibacteria group bacterium]